MSCFARWRWRRVRSKNEAVAGTAITMAVGRSCAPHPPADLSGYPRGIAKAPAVSANVEPETGLRERLGALDNRIIFQRLVRIDGGEGVRLTHIEIIAFFGVSGSAPKRAPKQLVLAASNTVCRARSHRIKKYRNAT